MQPLRRTFVKHLHLCHLRQKAGLDVWEDVAFGDGHIPQEFVHFFIFLRDQLEDFGRQLLYYCTYVNRRSGSNPFRVVALLMKSVDSPSWEFQPRPAAAALRLSFHLSTFRRSLMMSTRVVNKQRISTNDNKLLRSTKCICQVTTNGTFLEVTKMAAGFFDNPCRDACGDQFIVLTKDRLLIKEKVL
uniref:Uncharacterized protein n=1 Tax=Trichuris muris TaxID=70415 RepID=A0A5S6QBW6_TRIMR